MITKREMPVYFLHPYNRTGTTDWKEKCALGSTTLRIVLHGNAHASQDASFFKDRTAERARRPGRLADALVSTGLSCD
jgi:hypothetical protein